MFDKVVNTPLDILKSSTLTTGFNLIEYLLKQEHDSAGDSRKRCSQYF